MSYNHKSNTIKNRWQMSEEMLYNNNSQAELTFVQLLDALIFFSVFGRRREESLKEKTVCVTICQKLKLCHILIISIFI